MTVNSNHIVNRRFMAVLVAALLVLIPALGCGSDDDDSATSPRPRPAPTPAMASTASRKLRHSSVPGCLTSKRISQRSPPAGQRPDRTSLQASHPSRRHSRPAPRPSPRPGPRTRRPPPRTLRPTWSHFPPPVARMPRRAPAMQPTRRSSCRMTCGVHDPPLTHRLEGGMRCSGFGQSCSWSSG